MSDFKSMTEVYNHVEEALVIDLMEHVTTMEEKYQQALIEPPKGIYIAGAIEPLLQEGRSYYPRALYPNPRGKLKTLNDIASHSDDIVNEAGDIVLSFKDIVHKRKFITNEPTIPATALKVAVSIVEQYIISSCCHSKRSHPTYRLEYLVRPEYQDMIINDEYIQQFYRLRDKVMDFIRDDRWNVYFTRIKGTSLIIEKGLDFRVCCYYEHLFKSQESTED